MKRDEKARRRNENITFRTTSEERMQIEARIKVCGMPKAEYYIQSLLYQQINVNFGRYESERLSLEVRRLREQLEQSSDEEKTAVLIECRAFLDELVRLLKQRPYQENLVKK